LRFSGLPWKMPTQFHIALGVPMEKTFRTIRIVHFAFLWAWFLLLVALKFIGTTQASAPAYLPALLGLVSVTDITIGFFRRSRYLSDAAKAFQIDPESPAGLGNWRVANLLSFVFAQTISLFGFVLKFLGSSWNIAAIFFGAGLLLLIIWTPRKIQVMPRGVR
jgi:hypothetical protein